MALSSAHSPLKKGTPCTPLASRIFTVDCWQYRQVSKLVKQGSIWVKKKHSILVSGIGPKFDTCRSIFKILLRLDSAINVQQDLCCISLWLYCINHCFILLCFSFIIVSCFHLSLASWLLFYNKSSVHFSTHLKRVATLLCEIKRSRTANIWHIWHN